MPKKRTGTVADILGVAIEESKFGSSLDDSDVWAEIYKKHPELKPQKKSREISFSKLLGRKITKKDEKHITTKIFISAKKKKKRRK